MTTDARSFPAGMRRSLRENWGLFVVEGIVLVLAGALAVFLPQVATLAVTLFVGWLLLIVGVFQFVTHIMNRDAPGFWGWIVLSILMGLLGGMLIFRPVAGVITLTLALVAYFIAHGIAMLYLAYTVRGETGRWVWLVLGGILDFALAILVIAAWPGSATWILGLFVGINMLFTGFALIFAALGARSSDAPPAAQARAAE